MRSSEEIDKLREIFAQMAVYGRTHHAEETLPKWLGSAKLVELLDWVLGENNDVARIAENFEKIRAGGRPS